MHGSPTNGGKRFKRRTGYRFLKHESQNARSSTPRRPERFRLLDAEDGVVAEFFLDAEELLVFGDPVGTAHGAGVFPRNRQPVELSLKYGLRQEPDQVGRQNSGRRRIRQ